MACVDPPELQTQILLALLDEPASASPAVAAHLARCPHCQARATALGRAEGRLAAQLHRIACPDPHALGELQLGLLPADQASTMRAHIDSCPHCQSELRTLTAYMSDLSATIPESPGVIARARSLVAQLIRGSAAGGPALPLLAPIGMRGSMGAPLVYQAEHLQLTLMVEDAASGSPALRDLVGLVTGGPGRVTQAQLLQGDALVAEQAIDPGGNLILGEIAPGKYRLLLSGPELEVLIPELLVA